MDLASFIEYYRITNHGASILATAVTVTHIAILREQRYSSLDKQIISTFYQGKVVC